MDFYHTICALIGSTQPQSPLPNGGYRLSPDIRLGHNPNLEFHADDLESVKVNEDGVTEIEANFLGLLGAGAPIPDYLIQDLLSADEERSVVHDYLDLFHHRTYELLFFGLAQQDLWSHSCSDNPWAQALTRLLGVGPEAQNDLLLESLLSTGLILQKPNRDQLQTLLRHVLLPFVESSPNAEVTVLDFCGGSSPIQPHFQNRLAQRNHALGQDCVLGERIRDPSSAIRIVIGPLNPESQRAFEPGHPGHQNLLAVLRHCMPTPMDVDFELIIHDPNQDFSRLKNAQLGVNAALSGGPHPHLRRISQQISWNEDARNPRER